MENIGIGSKTVFKNMVSTFVLDISNLKYSNLICLVSRAENVKSHFFHWNREPKYYWYDLCPLHEWNAGYNSGWNCMELHVVFAWRYWSFLNVWDFEYPLKLLKVDWLYREYGQCNWKAFWICKYMKSYQIEQACQFSGIILIFYFRIYHIKTEIIVIIMGHVLPIIYGVNRT